MAKFSKRSVSHLRTCCDELKLIAYDAIKIIPFIVVEGHRDEERQNQLFKEGKTKAEWGQSPHNLWPSMAMDIAPIGEDGRVDWNDIAGFYDLGNVIMKVADFYQIRLVWGRSFKNLIDLPHFEMLYWKKDDDAKLS